MAKKPTYEELEQRVKELEKEVAKGIQNEAELKRERNIFLGGPVVVFKWAAKENWPAEYVSPNVTQFGYQAEDFMSGRILYINIIHSEDQKKIVSEVQEHSESGVAFYEQEYRIIQADGEIKWVYDFTLISRNDNNEITHYDGYVLEITERKQAEQALRENENNLKKAQKVSHVGSWDLDVVTGTLYWSDETYRIYGFKPHEFVPTYEKFQAILHPEDHERVQKAVAAALSGATDYDIDFRFMRPDGQTGWIHCDGQVTRDGEGKPIRFFGTQIDITERKQAEEALRESEERFVLFMDHFPDVVFMKDLKGRLVYANKAYKRRGGHKKKEDWYGKTNDQLWPPETAASFNKGDQEVLSKGRSMEFIESLPHPDGHIRTQMTTKFPVLKDRESVYLGGIGLDITDLKQTEEALRKSKDNLDKAQKIAHIGNWTRDLNLNQGEWSDELYRIYGLTPGDPADLPFEFVLSWIHPEDRERVAATLREAPEKKQPFGFEFRTIPIEGSEKIIRNRGEVEYDETGNPVRLFGTTQDITERRKLEEERLKVEKLESLGILAGGIAHDFNNILTAVMGNLSYAKMGMDRDSETYEVLQEAETASFRARNLTQQLLTFAKGGSPVKETASLSEVIRESGSFVLKGSNVRCDFTIPEDIWPTEIDVGQISQVAQNLIINADQAMPDGGVIKIEMENRVIGVEDALPLPSGKYVHVSVRDKEIGIPEKHLPKILDPYFSTKDKGSGLGLATAHSIIKKHGGHITVDSELGEGTLFHFYLPASEKEMGEAGALEGELIKGDGRVLVMDDEESLRNLAHQVLGRMGYHVESAKDGEEAIEKYVKAMKEGEPFDAVILDLTIPGGMGGKETIKKLKKIDPKVKATVASGYSDDPVMANFKDYGFFGVVSKPFNLNKLSWVLHDVLTSNDK